MPEITKRRTGEFLRTVLEILLEKPDGLRARDVLAAIPNKVRLTAFETGYYPTAPNSQRFEKIVRFATIGLVKAGWLVKAKGCWYITEEGQQAYNSFRDPEQFEREVDRLYLVWRNARPEEEPLEVAVAAEPPKSALSLEEVEELASQQVEALVADILPYDFQQLVADLLQAMGYFIYWVAPPGPDGGLDIIAYSDPLGARGSRVKVQVKHKIDEHIQVEPLRAFMSVIAADEIGLYVSSGGFTKIAEQEARSQDKRKMTLIDLDSLISLWIEFYPKLSQEARQRLPLKPVYFPAPAE